MEYRNLGGSGLKVPTLCLGGMTFGEPSAGSFMHGIASSDADSFAIMSRALDAGVNFIDVADVYGDDGRSEKVVGAWLDSTKARDRMIIATKFRFRMSPEANGTGASRFRIMRTVEDSLKRLRTDRIDLYQVHAQDLHTPEEETLRALDDLVTQGKVLYLGASNYAAYRLASSQWISKTEHLHRFVAFQAQYSLVVRDLEREHVPLCLEHRIGILPWSPLAGGFLSGKYDKTAAPPEGTRLAKWKERLAAFDTPRNWKILEAVRQIAAERNTTRTAVALAWAIQKPGVTSVIFGARSLDQLNDNLKGAELALTPEDMKRLDEASAIVLGYPYEMLKGVQGRW